MPEIEKCKDLAIASLEGMKAVDLVVLDVRGTSSVTDFMILVSGTSSRHVKAMASSLAADFKKMGQPPLGVEGEQQGDWVLVDLGDVVAHIMRAETREFYQLEKLWGDDAPAESQARQ